MRYVDKFLNFNCAGDILQAIGPCKNWPKEITEAMAVRKQISQIVLKEENKLNHIHIDLCSGNALAPILSAFTLPVFYSYAIDKRERTLHRPIRKFTYLFEDIYNLNLVERFPGAKNIIITAIHPCGDLANQTIKLYNELKSNNKYLFLMPCCRGKNFKETIPTIIQEKIGNYLTWSVYLYNQVKSNNKDIIVDNNIISPCNSIIKARN